MEIVDIVYFLLRIVSFRPKSSKGNLKKGINCEEKQLLQLFPPADDPLGSIPNEYDPESQNLPADVP